VFCILFFFIFRSIFILLNLKAVGNTVGVSDYLDVFLMGFRFDATVSGYFLAIPFLALLLLSPFGKMNYIRTIRLFFQGLFIVLSTIICVVTINYYNEYNDQFNHFLFLGLYDDQKAVLKTILADFNPFLNLIVLVGVMWGSFKIFKHFEKQQHIVNFLIKIKKTPYKILLILLSIVLFIGNIRGGLGKNPAMLKWAFVSSDAFLNKTIINPYRSFNYALSDFEELNAPKGDNPYGKLSAQEKNIKKLILKKAKGDTLQAPKQIFLVVMESYDAWPLLNKYECFGLSDNLKAIQQKGLRFVNFLPSAQSTLNSFGAITTGVPYVGVNINQLGAINGPFMSSIFDQFKRLGYETNFFYGGFLSWQNIGNIMKNQGADHLYSAPNAGGKTETGVWGIEDEKLFDLVYKTVDTTKNSINVILTTSYHPPYKIDVYKKGFPYKTKADLPIEAQQYYDGSMSMKAMGHLWYSDQAIGDFMRKAENKFTDGLFCFTGDHFGRRFVNAKPNLFEHSAVPFIMYGKNIEKGIINKTPGSHIDIIPTLIEMVAPKGFEYYSFGQSLLNNKDKNIGFAQQKIITKTELEVFMNENIYQFYLDTKKTKKIEHSKYLPQKNELLKNAWFYTIHKNK